MNSIQLHKEAIILEIQGQAEVRGIEIFYDEYLMKKVHFAVGQVLSLHQKHFYHVLNKDRRCKAIEM